jgi:hypothetical protein
MGTMVGAAFILLPDLGVYCLNSAGSRFNS